MSTAKESGEFNLPTSILQIQEWFKGPVLFRSKVPIIGRCHVVVDVEWIQMVGDVVNAEGALQRVVLHPRQEGNAKLFGKFKIKGHESGKTQAVGLAHVVLQGIDRRIRETCMNVQHRAGGDFPRQIDFSPGNESIRNIGVQGRNEVGTNYRLFEWYKYLREKV